MAIKCIPEPFRIKVVENIKVKTRAERETAIKNADYNLFNLKGEDCYIDLLTDSGTNAMSQEQWAGLMIGDEAYAGGSSYYKVINVFKDIFGYDYIQPVHQGRAAEKVLFPLLLKNGQYAISNTFFDTTRAHVEIAGARAIDCLKMSAKDPTLREKFKGNMDIQELKKLLNKYGNKKIGMVVMTITNNSAGGQPVSMKNIKEVSCLCKQYGIPLIIDAARFAENTYFIKRDENEYQNKRIEDIVKEFFSYADAFTMSAKKDCIVNTGGIIAIKDAERNKELLLKIKASCISFEGFLTYGGLTGRDLESLALGAKEGLNEDYLRYRIGQLEYLGSKLDDEGILYQAPVGGHGIFLDAKAMFPNIPYYQFPGQVLAVELYKEAGIRSCDIGSFMLGNDPDTGKQLEAKFEFTRLAIPRRVYTQSHLDVIVEALKEIRKRAKSIQHGYKIIWEPPILRHFQAKLLPIG